MKKRLRVGTRTSPLALQQTQWVIDRLKAVDESLQFDIVSIMSQGDQEPKKQLREFTERGIFCGTLERAMLRGEVDFCVHSLKDMPRRLDPDFVMAAYCEREDARDCLVTAKGVQPEDLPEHAVIGTSSPRRQMQLHRLLPKASCQVIRGNVTTRIEKLLQGDYDAIVLAMAGLRRLGLMEDERIEITALSPREMVPAAGQAMIAVETLKTNSELKDWLHKHLNDEDSEKAYGLECEILQFLGAGCQMPIAAHATREGDELKIFAYNGCAGRGKDKYVEQRIESLEDVSRLKGALCGKVSLTGVGPGAPDLLTLRALETIRQADVLVIDRLGTERLEFLYPAKAQRIYVGKACSDHSVPQEEIEQIMIEKAKQGFHVVRLKGGDPLVFGRGGEEALALKEAGIPWEFIPGLTSATAVPELLGLPLTHRGLSLSFHVITAHEAQGDHVNYQALADCQGTLVFLMGSRQLQKIQHRLLEAGMDPQTPVALLERGASRRQRRKNGVLQDLVLLGESMQLVSPALVVVGPTAALDLAGKEEKGPLQGVSLWLSRSQQPLDQEPTSRSMAQRLRTLGADVIESSGIELHESRELLDELDGRLEAWLEKKKSNAWLIVSSAHSANSMLRAMKRLKRDLRSLADIKIAVTGPGTSEFLQNQGIHADLVPEHYTGVSLAKALQKEQQASIMLLHSDRSHPRMMEMLQRDHRDIEDAIVYETRSRRISAAELSQRLKDVDGLIFTSSAGVRSFVESYQGLQLELPEVFVIGPRTRETAQELGLGDVIMPRDYCAQGLMDCLVKHFREKRK